MAKKLIRLTENDLVGVIKSAVKKLLGENKKWLNDDIDITKIPVEILKRGYFDYRLAPSSCYYGNILNEPVTIKEAIAKIYPPDTVAELIVGKYNIPPQLVVRTEHFHHVFVYVITALIGVNDKLVEDDMGKLGYFLARRGQITEVENMKFQALQFEPQSQLQKDVTDEVKSKYNELLHWTPVYNVESILKNGLVPNSKNSVFNYPLRTYLMEGDSTKEQIMFLGRLLCLANASANNNGQYALLAVNINGLNESIRFFYDPNSEIGIYTEQPIEGDRIKVKEVANLKELKPT